MREHGDADAEANGPLLEPGLEGDLRQSQYPASDHGHVLDGVDSLPRKTSTMPSLEIEIDVELSGITIPGCT